jgi:hypothetical protein
VNSLLVTTKRQCQHLLGRFCDGSHFDIIIAEDTDCFTTTGSVVFKFRKNAFSGALQWQAYESLQPAAVTTENRGQAAGPITGEVGGREWVTPDQIATLFELMQAPTTGACHFTMGTQGYVWRRSNILAERPQYEAWFRPWHNEVAKLSPEEQKKAAEHVIRNYISNTSYAMPATSGVAGYMDRYPRIPYGRPTSYTRKHPRLFAGSFAFVNNLDDLYKRELPGQWLAQRRAADSVDPRFLIAGSVFSTLTVNYNWRTAAHRDEGDFRAGFSAIAAFTGRGGKGWAGGEFILPEYRVAIRLEPTDLLFVSSHNLIHANGPLLGRDKDRLTVVAYFREGMLQLGCWEYERLRKTFVMMQGGITKGMWYSKAWADFLTENNMVDEDGLV